MGMGRRPLPWRRRSHPDSEEGWGLRTSFCFRRRVDKFGGKFADEYAKTDTW
jgi:hypothetical protein